MSKLDETLARIAPLDRARAARIQARLDAKTKPRRSLGRLEDVACRVAAILGTEAPAPLVKAVVVMGADHGIAEAGVSAYPQAVTREMFRNFLRGGAAINVLARLAGARLVLVDMGLVTPLEPDPALRVHRIGPGTQNFLEGPAMARSEAIRAVEFGVSLAEELTDEGVTLIALGEMGIGNTTASSALVALLTGIAVEEVVGRGTGLDDAGLLHKVEVVRRAVALHGAAVRGDPLEALARVGGFEIAGLVGVALGAASRRVPILLDGFISSTAALVASRCAPGVLDHLIASHRSVEAGHRMVLTELGTSPLLDLDLRLGEGSGAALAMGLVEAAVAILREMATFESAAVSDSGR